MRALPGRSSRSQLGSSTQVTRESAAFDQRRRILLATGELVAKRGYGDVTVELIVKRARVSFKTFYKHFPNKEACFVDLIDSAYIYTQHRIRRALAAEPGLWPEQVIVALRTYVELIVANPVMARACIVEGPTAGPVIFEHYERAIRAFTPLFSRGREFVPNGAQLPPTIEIILAGSVLWSAYQRLIVGEVDRIGRLLPELIELVLRPYLGEEEAARLARSDLGAVVVG